MRGLCRSRESLKYEEYDSAPAKATQLRLGTLGAEAILARALSDGDAMSDAGRTRRNRRSSLVSPASAHHSTDRPELADRPTRSLAGW